MDQDAGGIRFRIRYADPCIHERPPVGPAMIIQFVKHFRVESAQSQMDRRIDAARFAGFADGCRESFPPVGGNPAPCGEIGTAETFGETMKFPFADDPVPVMIIPDLFPDQIFFIRRQPGDIQFISECPAERDMPSAICPRRENGTVRCV